MARICVNAAVTLKPTSEIAGAGPQGELLALPTYPVYAHATFPKVDDHVNAAVTVLPGQLEVVL